MPPKPLSKTLGGLLLDGDRVQHVPGIALRRAVMLHDTRVLGIMAPHHDAEPVLNRSLAIHDFVAVFPELLSDCSHPERYFEELDWPLWTDWSEKAAVLCGQVDVLVAEAAAGNLDAIRAILRQSNSSSTSAFCVDWELMIETACANRHSHVANWLMDARESQLSKPMEATRDIARHREQHALVMLQSRPTVIELPCPTLCIRHDGQQDTTDSVFISVLTNPALMEQVGIFQEDSIAFVYRYERHVPGSKHMIPSVWASRVGVLPRLAIIRGDLDALKQLYYAKYCSRTTTESHHCNMLHFQLTMHLAACEGRLEILQWLHSRSHKCPQEICCRPDTMAMAARCGWADVVEWLHLNRPESAQSMSELAINDAAKWGHVDVLRVCHKYNLGTFTTTAVEYAARAGHLDVLRFVCAVNDGTLFTSNAMDAAVAHGHIDIVRDLCDTWGERIEPRHLAISVQSHTESASLLAQHRWSIADRSSDEIKRIAHEQFPSVCENQPKFVIGELLPFVITSGSTVALWDGLRAAVKSQRLRITSLLLPLCRQDPLPLSNLLQLAVRTKHKRIVSLLVKTERIPVVGLSWALYTAVKKPELDMVDLLVDLHVDALNDEALYDISDSDRLNAIKQVHARCSRTAAIRTLEETRSITAAEFLLVHEQRFYTERILMAVAPSCVLPQLVRFLLTQQHQVSVDTVADFSGVTRQRQGFLTVQEIKSLRTCGDNSLLELTASRRENLVQSQLLEDLMETRGFQAIAFLYKELEWSEALRIALAFLLKNDPFGAIPEELFELVVENLSETEIQRILNANRMDLVSSQSTGPRTQ